MRAWVWSDPDDVYAPLEGEWIMLAVELGDGRVMGVTYGGWLKDCTSFLSPTMLDASDSWTRAA